MLASLEQLHLYRNVLQDSAWAADSPPVQGRASGKRYWAVGSWGVDWTVVTGSTSLQLTQTALQCIK